jgi:hypothetical protein
LEWFASWWDYIPLLGTLNAYLLRAIIKVIKWFFEKAKLKQE